MCCPILLDLVDNWMINAYVNHLDSVYIHLAGLRVIWLSCVNVTDTPQHAPSPVGKKECETGTRRAEMSAWATKQKTSLNLCNNLCELKNLCVIISNRIPSRSNQTCMAFETADRYGRFPWTCPYSPLAKPKHRNVTPVPRIGSSCLSKNWSRHKPSSPHDVIIPPTDQ